MKSFRVWFSLLGREVVKSVSDRFIPAHPILAAFLFIGSILLFLGSLTALIIGLWMALSMVLSQVAAIWTLFGILALLALLCVLFGYQSLKPRTDKLEMPHFYLPKREDFSLDKLIGSFFDGFFSK